MTRLRGRAPRGDRLNAAAPFGHWRTQTLIAGLTTEALVAPWIIDGAMNGEAFALYVETQLAPALEPRTVVVLDNLAVHRNARAAEALRERGCWCLFLPPYSPDHVPGLRPLVAENRPPGGFPGAPRPIEMAFAKLKAHLRRIGARSFDTLLKAIGDICDLFTPDECWNFLRHAGYAST